MHTSLLALIALAGLYAPTASGPGGEAAYFVRSVLSRGVLEDMLLEHSPLRKLAEYVWRVKYPRSVDIPPRSSVATRPLDPGVDRPAGGSVGVVALQPRAGPVQPGARPEGEAP